VKKAIIQNLIILMLAIGIFFVYLLFRPINFNINRTFMAQHLHILYPEEVKYLEIVVQGRYSLYLFRENIFRGKITIEGFEYTNDAYVALSINPLSNVLSYFNHSTGNTLLLGEINIAFLFRNFDIIIYNRYDSYNLAEGYIDMVGDSNIFISTSSCNKYELLNRYSRFINKIRDGESNGTK